MTRLASIALLLGAAVLGSCSRNAAQDISGPVAGARIRFFNFGVNAPGVNFYANDAKVTAISSATGQESTTGTGYGAVASTGYYSALTPGQYTFTGRIAATTDNGLAISQLTTALEDGKSYSLYQSGFYDATAKSVDAFLVVDDFAPQIDYSAAYVRFVNAISNANPLTLYAKNTTSGAETAIGTPVAYKSAGTFTKLADGVYDLGARYANTSTNAIGRTAVSFSAGRVYTISARGDITVTSSTAANRPYLDNSANR